MSENALEMVRLRNNFYRDSYRLAIIVMLCSVLLNLVLAFFIGYQYLEKPNPVYFATNRDGTLLKIVPLDKPILNDAAVLSWANRAALAIQSFDFLNYRQQLNSARKYFTRRGFDGYVNSLEQSGNLAAVKTKRMVVKAVTTDLPVVRNKALFSGRLAWQIQIPMTIRYVSASERFKQSVVVTMVLLRVSSLDSSDGIAIDSFVTANAGG